MRTADCIELEKRLQNFKPKDKVLRQIFYEKTSHVLIGI